MAEEFKITQKVITVAGRRLTVSKATFEAQLKRFTLIEEIETSMNVDGVPQEGEGIEAIVRRGFHRMTYPSLSVCTTGKIPTEAECYQIENDDLDFWLATARELNPNWFPAVSAETVETDKETLEKKE